MRVCIILKSVLLKCTHKWQCNRKELFKARLCYYFYTPKITTTHQVDWKFVLDCNPFALLRERGLTGCRLPLRWKMRLSNKQVYIALRCLLVFWFSRKAGTTKPLTNLKWTVFKHFVDIYKFKTDFFIGDWFFNIGCKQTFTVSWLHLKPIRHNFGDNRIKNISPVLVSSKINLP